MTLMSKLRSNTKGILLVAGILMLVGTLIGYVALAGSTKVPSRYMGEINGTKIERTRFERNFALVWNQQYQASYGQLTGYDIEPMKAQYLLNVMMHEALVSEAEKMGITVTDEEVNANLRELEEQFGGAEQLKTQLNYLGMTMEELKDDLKKDLVLGKLQDELLKDFTVTDDEVRRQLEEVEASHILVTDRELAETILKALKDGADFAQMAKLYSEDPGSKDSGGSLGYFGRGVMVQEFEDAAFGLDVGEVSDIVTSDYGYHIITVTDRKTADDATFEEKKEEAREQLLNIKRSEIINKFVSEVQEKSDIVIYDAQLKGYQALMEGRIDDAIKAYTEATGYATSDPYLLGSLAEAYRRKGDLDKAWELNKQAVEISVDPNVMINMALVGETKIRNIINAQDTEEEMSVYQWAAGDHEFAEAKKQISAIYDEIVAALSKASENSQGDLMTHYQLAQAYRYFGDTEREDQELSIVSQIIAQYDDAEADDAPLRIQKQSWRTQKSLLNSPL